MKFVARSIVGLCASSTVALAFQSDALIDLHTEVQPEIQRSTFLQVLEQEYEKATSQLEERTLAYTKAEQALQAAAVEPTDPAHYHEGHDTDVPSEDHSSLLSSGRSGRKASGGLKPKKQSLASELSRQLEEEYSSQVQKLQDLTSGYHAAQQRMTEARKEANELRVKLHEEQERLQRQEAERVERLRIAREALMRKAEHVFAEAVGANGSEDSMGGVTVSMLVDVFMAMPEALADEKFSSVTTKAASDLQSFVTNFTDVTRARISLFVHSSASASDAELAYSMAKFFHEMVVRVHSLHRHVEMAGSRVKWAMPEDLRKGLAPIMSLMSESLPRLSMNSSELAKGSLGDSCDTVSEIMGNMSDYDFKLAWTRDFLDNTSASIMPTMAKVMPVSHNVSVFIKNIWKIADLEIRALQDVSREMVREVGPVVTDRVHCAWGGAPRRRPWLGLLLAALLPAATGWSPL